MQISTKTVSFDGDDVDYRINELVERNSEASCSSDDMAELIGLLHFRNDNSDGPTWMSTWADAEWTSEHATSTLQERIKDRMLDEAHYSVDFDGLPFKHIDWDAVVEEKKDDLNSATLTIGDESTTFYTFDEL